MKIEASVWLGVLLAVSLPAHAADLVVFSAATLALFVLSFVGLANANVARMVIGDINARGGLLNRPLELYLEDGATDDAVAAAKAAKLVQRDQVDVIALSSHGLQRVETLGRRRQFLDDQVVLLETGRIAAAGTHDELLAQGIVLKDGPGGTTWEVKR